METNEQQSTSVQRQEFGAVEKRAPSETAATAAAAREKASIEARYIMAINKPRNWDNVRQSLLKECRRPSFAHNKSTLYRKPIGEGVEGLGIRFVEVALRCMTNVMPETSVVFEDDLKRIIRVTVTDLESNMTWVSEVTVHKTVERKFLKDGQEPLSKRVNSQGKTTYLVEATEDDLLNKQNALISKAIRTLGLRIVPGDLQDEAEDIIRAIRVDRAAKDPDAERKAVLDAFAELNVPVAELTDCFGDPKSWSPKQLVDMRGLFGAIRDGETTWGAVLDAKGKAPQPEGGKPAGFRKPASQPQEPTKKAEEPQKPAPKQDAPSEPAQKQGENRAESAPTASEAKEAANTEDEAPKAPESKPSAKAEEPKGNKADTERTSWAVKVGGEYGKAKPEERAKVAADVGVADPEDEAQWEALDTDALKKAFRGFVQLRLSRNKK